MNSLDVLVLNQVLLLGKEAFTAHEDLQRYREQPLTTVEQTELSVKLKTAIEQQHRWIVALLDQKAR